mgnify:CR=1 FL=1
MPDGGAEDRRGTDARSFGLFGNERVQIKFDATIAKSGNLYHELYEKTKGKEQQRWRVSPHLAEWYIFTTVGMAWLIPVDVMAEVETGLRLTCILKSSIGLLFPFTAVEAFGCERKEHRL